MATPMDIPFSEYEKRFVLAEAIKTSTLPLDSLLSIIRDGGVQPNWTEMLLPGGRNLKSCVEAFESLTSTTPSTSSNKRKSTSQFFEPFTDSSRKRRQSGIDTITAARNIQPKPAANGSPFSSGQALSTSVPKKRGRPSKADIEARQAEAAARGEILPVPAPKTPSSAKGSRKSLGAGGTGSGAAAVAPMVASGPASEPIAKGSFEVEAQAQAYALENKRKLNRPSSRGKTPKAVEEAGESATLPVNLGKPANEAEEVAGGEEMEAPVRISYSEPDIQESVTRQLVSDI